MPNGFQDNSQSQDIGSLILQAGRWERIEESVKAGVPIRGIAKVLLEEDNDIRAYYEKTGSSNPLKTLSNVITYHVREKLSVAERIGIKMFHAFFERETGELNILTKLKQMVEVQEERAGKAIELERRLGIVTQQAGREMMILLSILNTLGKLSIAAGLDLKEQSPRPVASEEEKSSEGGRMFYTFLELLRRHGYSDKKAVELVTGIPDLMGDTKDEPDPLGLGNISLIDAMRRAERKDMNAEQAPATSH